MANYAALNDVLSVAGSRKSDGSANASGTVYFFQPGTNTPVNAYSDAAATTIITQPVTLNSGGLLSLSDFPNGIFVTQPVRLLVQDVSGNSVVDTTYIPATAGDVGVSNAGFTDSTLDAVLTKAKTSFNGRDFTYLIASGQTERPYNAVITEISAWLTAFGAKGDGVAIDTTAIQNAINFVKAAGGGTVYLPPGTYVVDQALTITSASGVYIRGAGIAATVVQQTNGTANGFTLTTCTDFGVSDMTITHSATSTGAAIAIASATRVRLIAVKALHYAYGLSGTTFTSSLVLDSCSLEGSTASIKLVAIVRGSITNSLLSSPTGSGTGIGINFDGICGKIYVAACQFLTDLVTGISWTNFVGSGDFTVVACPLLGGITTGFLMAGATNDLVLRQFGNDLDGVSVDVLSGATVTPNRLRGPETKIRGTTTGSAYVVAAPTPSPQNGSAQFGDLYLHFFNNAGAPITGWTMNASYHTSAGPSTVDGEHTLYHFRWDEGASVWRQVARQVTT